MLLQQQSVQGQQQKKTISASAFVGYFSSLIPPRTRFALGTLPKLDKK